jgi:pimeloyl-ACP methyl ester carboxylesterase
MLTFVLVHGAWHGPWAWDRLVPLLHAAGARALTPELGSAAGHGLHDDAGIVAAALDSVAGDEVVLVGHSYAGLVVREAADLRPGAVRHVVLVDGWAGADGTSLLDLAPGPFGQAMHAAAGVSGLVPAPPPSAFGVESTEDAAWLAQRLRAQPLRTLTEATRLSGAVDEIPGTAVCCRPQAYPFEAFAAAAGYRTITVDCPHDGVLTHPGLVTRVLLGVREQEARSLK